MLIALLLTVAPLKLEGCAPTNTEVGSLHATVGFDTQLVKAGSKLKQPLECSGKKVTLFISELDSEKAVGIAANFTGPQLWGDSGPSAEHSDELMTKGPLLVVISGPGVAAAATALSAQGFKVWREQPSRGAALDRLRTELDCKSGSKDPLRGWCPAARIAGAGFTAPKGDAVYLGVSAPLPDDVELRPALLAATRISTLAFSKGHVYVSDVKPDNEDEKRQLAQVAASVGLALKSTDKQRTVAVSKDLLGYLGTLAGLAVRKGAVVTDDPKQPAAFKLTFPARAWTIGDAFVIAEDAPDGQWVSVFPVATATAAP
jgi:hypothetical protein